MLAGCVDIIELLVPFGEVFDLGPFLGLVFCHVGRGREGKSYLLSVMWPTRWSAWVGFEEVLLKGVVEIEDMLAGVAGEVELDGLHVAQAVGADDLADADDIGQDAAAVSIGGDIEWGGGECAVAALEYRPPQSGRSGWPC